MNEPKLDLAYFKKKLIELREELEEVQDTGAKAAQVVELDQARVSRLSRMDALQAQSMSVETKRRRDLQLRRVGAALIYPSVLGVVALLVVCVLLVAIVPNKRSIWCCRRRSSALIIPGARLSHLPFLRATAAMPTIARRQSPAG